MINFDFCYATDIGLKRERNEDITFAKTNKYGDTILLALDGMGGHRKGDIASKKAFAALNAVLRSSVGMYFLSTVSRIVSAISTLTVS